jgi:hypothetical protein
MDAEKYALAKYNSDLRKDEKLFDAQVDASMKPASEQPPPPGQFKSDSGFESATHRVQHFTDLYGQLSAVKQKELLTGMIRHVGKAEPTYDKDGNVTGVEEGKTTVYETLRNWAGVNNWSKIDTDIVVKALGGPNKFNVIKQKLKGLYQTLSNPVEQKIPYKETVAGTTSDIKFSTKSNNIYVTDMDDNVAEMTVQDFLSQNAATLVKVKDIRIGKTYQGY